MPGSAVCSCSAGAAIASSSPPASTTETSGRRSTRSTIAPQIRPSPSSRRRRWTNGTRSRSTLSPSLESSAGSTVSDPSIGDGDHDHRGHPEGARSPSPAKSMPAMATITVAPGDEHRAARRGRGYLERVLLAPPGGPFLAFALQVEHRVVDPDGEADQEHQRVDGLVARPDLARDSPEAEGGEDGRQGEQQRDAGGDERAEDDDEDEQGDRDRVEPGLAEVGEERALERVVGARVAELADEELRVGRLSRRDSGEDRLDLVDRVVRVAADLEVDERGRGGRRRPARGSRGRAASAPSAPRPASRVARRRRRSPP